MFGIATDEQWGKMKKFIKNDKYTKDDFYVFETVAVGDRIVPNRYQRITRSALEVMAEDAKKGVSLMLNHNESQLGVQSIPIGKVFDGRIESGKQSGENNTLILSQYIPKDESKVDGYSKSDIIRLIDTGVIEDTSVGFSISSQTATCSICHNPYFSGRCSHIRGYKYSVEENSDKTEQCILEINAPACEEMHDGNIMLSENSVVFDGAYPNAMIQQSADGDYIKTSNGKYKVLNEKTNLNNESILCYASNQDIKLMYKPVEEGGKENMENEKEVLSNEVEENVEETPVENVQPEETQENEVEEVVENEVAEETTEEVVEEAVEQKEEVKNTLSISEDELKEAFGELAINKEMILKLAKEGQKYRENIIEEALNSGVRAMGNDFAKDSFRKSFELMNTEDIIKSKEAFERSVTEKFGNGRVSVNHEKKESFEYEKRLDFGSLKTSIY